jgi:DNA polymerase III subunit delta'
MSQEADQEIGAEHPRERLGFVGHENAEAELSAAIAGGRMHHAWLICGPKGVGKATLAYRAARVLLGARQTNDHALAVDPNDPMVRQIAQLSHPDLLVVRRSVNDTTGKLRTEITVDDARKLGQFFSLKASVPGGRRVAIIDAADELNRNAANAILKTLEESPEGGVIFLVCHAAGKLLPTIRSRCRRLVLEALDDAQVRSVAGSDADPAAIVLAQGSPGRATALASAGVGSLYRKVSSALSGLPRLPLADASALAEAGGKSDFAFDVLFDVLENWLIRVAQAGAGLPILEVEPGESAGMERMARAAGGRRVVEAWDKVREVRTATHGLNLDKTASVLEALRHVRRSLAPQSARAA